MPTDSPSKTKSWSLRSMLGIKGTSKDKNGEGKKRKKQDRKDEECGSIKERVLAKLKEPVPSEIKQLAGRHSVDAFSPRLSKLKTYASDTNVETEEARYSVSRHSTSSYSDAASSNCSYAFQASVQTPSSACSTYRTCTSPTNVIARLMGLSHDTIHTHVALLNRQTEHTQQTSSRSLWMQMQQDKAMRMSSMGGSRRDSAQDFLDEMEDHLKQCDRALERIEAVMQLKKKLLYLNTRAANRTNVYEYCARTLGSDLQATRPKTVEGGAHRRASSVDRIVHSCETKPLELLTRTPLTQHRRSVSDGESPVFRPSGNQFIELDITKSMELHEESFKKWQTVGSEYSAARVSHMTSTPPHCSPNIPLDDTVHRPTCESNSEQPSPVSVLDSNIPDDSTSEDDRDAHIDLSPGSSQKKRNVVRALFTTEAGASAVTKTRVSPSTTGVDDAEVVKRMDCTWLSGISAEIAAVGVAVEGMIFRRLVEETIIQVASVARFRSPRKQ